MSNLSKYSQYATETDPISKFVYAVLTYSDDSSRRESFRFNSEVEALDFIEQVKADEERKKHPVITAKVDGPKLVRVRAVATKTKKADIKYVGYFEDGSVRVIRTSPRAYRSVAQIAGRTYTQWDRVTPYAEEFLFSGKGAPSVSKYLAPFHVVTVAVA